MRYATKKMATEVLDREKEMRETAYYDGVLKLSDMERMLTYRMGFGEAEAKFILASMIKAGAKFLID